jgi:hypothetical protein
MQRHRARLDQAGQIADVIGVKMGDEHDVEPVERQSGFAQAHEGAGTGVRQDAWNAVDQDDMTRSRSPQGARSAGAQRHQFKRRGWSGGRAVPGARRAVADTEARDGGQTAIGSAGESSLPCCSRQRALSRTHANAAARRAMVDVKAIGGAGIGAVEGSAFGMANSVGARLPTGCAALERAGGRRGKLKGCGGDCGEHGFSHGAAPDHGGAFSRAQAGMELNAARLDRGHAGRSARRAIFRRQQAMRGRGMSRFRGMAATSHQTVFSRECSGEKPRIAKARQAGRRGFAARRRAQPER